MLDKVLDHDHFDMRSKFRDPQFSRDPLFIPRFNIDLPTQRQISLERLQKICNLNAFSVYDFATEPTKIFAAHEMASIVTDGSTCTKMTVQFNLFGGTVLKLGDALNTAPTANTSFAKSVLDGVDSLSNIGCFGLTELGYGNNAVEMETTATYCPEKCQFEIDCPSFNSVKFWITNSADHAKWCIVFAQLLVPKGDSFENFGVHGFLIRIRDDFHQPMTGVTINDMGLKMGCNGVDNGKIKFSKVIAPLSSLLSKFTTVNSANSPHFTSEIPKRRDRFLAVANQLLSGRVCIASMCLQASKIGVSIGLLYGNSRKTTSPVNGKSETPILKYQLNRVSIVPLWATVIAQNICLNFVKDYYAIATCHNHSIGDYLKFRKSSGNNFTHAYYSDSDNGYLNHGKTLDEILIILTSVLKPWVTWTTSTIGNNVRERCGGQGYQLVNRLGEIVGFGHAGMTAEGDNAVLWVKAAKEILDMSVKGDLDSLLPPKSADVSPEISRILDEWRSYFIENCETFSALLAQNVLGKSKEYSMSFWIEKCSNECLALSRSYVELIALWTMSCAIKVISVEKFKSTLTRIFFLCASEWRVSSPLYVSRRVQKDSSSSYESLRLERDSLVDSVIDELASVQSMVDIFNLSTLCMDACPIAGDGWSEFNQYDTSGEVLVSKL